MPLHFLEIDIFSWKSLPWLAKKPILRSDLFQFARHLAAKKVLDQIIQSGNHVKYAIPGRTQQEAEDYL